MKFILFFVFFEILVARAEARLSPAWIHTPAYAPNVELLMNASGSSYVAVQAHHMDDQKIKKLFGDLRRKASLPELLPHRCFELDSKTLKTRQTWCQNSRGEVFAFIESGPVRMKDNELRELQFGVLEQQK
jgi:hypothetical protein